MDRNTTSRISGWLFLSATSNDAAQVSEIIPLTNYIKAPSVPARSDGLDEAHVARYRVETVEEIMLRRVFPDSLGFGHRRRAGQSDEPVEVISRWSRTLQQQSVTLGQSDERAREVRRGASRMIRSDGSKC